MKTQRLIAAASRRLGRLHYVPIDVSSSALEESARRLTRQFPALKVTGYVADYRSGLERILSRARGPRMIVFLGSSLGNYDQDAAAELLGMIRQTMRPEDTLLLGTDLAKEQSVLEAAYDDAQGVTAAFNLNLLRRINRELGADFAVDAFAHRAELPRRSGPGRDAPGQHPGSDCDHRGRSYGFPVRRGRIDPHGELPQVHSRDALGSESAAGFVEDAAWIDDLAWFRLQRRRPDPQA